MNFALLLASLVASAGNAASIVDSADGTHAVTQRMIPIDTARAVLEIRGMACASCAHTVKTMLKRTAGVITAYVSVPRSEAIVEFDPAVVSTASILDVVRRLGYKARLKSDRAGATRRK